MFGDNVNLRGGPKNKLEKIP